MLYSGVSAALSQQKPRHSPLEVKFQPSVKDAYPQKYNNNNNNTYQADIAKNGTDPRCRLCEDKVETIDHLVAGCPIRAAEEYKERHDKWDIIHIGEYVSTTMLHTLVRTSPRSSHGGQWCNYPLGLHNTHRQIN